MVGGVAVVEGGDDVAPMGKKFKHGSPRVKQNVKKALESFEKEAAHGSVLAIVDARLIYVKIWKVRSVLMEKKLRLVIEREKKMEKETEAESHMRSPRCDGDGNSDQEHGRMKLRNQGHGS
ncbi:hypothetical protein HN51_014882 [Arachis hypogaea]